MLLPDSVMDELIHGTENRSYQEYLRKLKRVFQKYTCKAHVDLILYSSVISDYIMTGELSLGNVAHQMEPEQVKAHINYLARCLEENENFRLFVYKCKQDDAESILHLCILEQIVKYNIRVCVTFKFDNKTNMFGRFVTS